MIARLGHPRQRKLEREARQQKASFLAPEWKIAWLRDTPHKVDIPAPTFFIAGEGEYRYKYRRTPSLVTHLGLSTDLLMGTESVEYRAHKPKKMKKRLSEEKGMRSICFWLWVSGDRWKELLT